LTFYVKHEYVRLYGKIKVEMTKLGYCDANSTFPSQIVFFIVYTIIAPSTVGLGDNIHWPLPELWIEAPPRDNRSKVTIVIYRTEHMWREQADKITKVDHVKKVLEDRRYKRWICYVSVILHAHYPNVWQRFSKSHHIHVYHKRTTSLTSCFT